LKQSQEARKKESNWGLYLGIGVVLVVLGIIGAIVLAPNAPPSDTTFSNEELSFQGHVKANPDAKVVVVEFSDFQCPACGTAFRPIQDLVERYNTEIKFVYRHFPLVGTHPFAVAAAEASECANEQGKFWEMHDALFLNQSTWSPIGRDAIRNQAESIGLDMEKFDACIASRKFVPKIQKDMDDAVRFGVYSTPSFFVNGKRIDGFNQSEIERAVEDALKQ